VGTGLAFAMADALVQGFILAGYWLWQINTHCLAGHGNWLPWLEREFGWTDKTAERFIQVANVKFDKLSNLDIGVSSLYLLAAPSTPEGPAAATIPARAPRSASGRKCEGGAFSVTLYNWRPSVRKRGLPLPSHRGPAG
jgi:hypothetical protein